MSFLESSFLSSNPSLNRALAWSMGSRGEGRFHIKFPLQAGWYDEQPCTTFRSLEHRKERTGFQHEYIVLNLGNGAICRLERMGDADARFNAILPRGSTAYDFAQCFQPEHLSQAHLHSSDVIIQTILPIAMDLKDVLRVCRAIQEGDKTCNYTLQIFNCYFFCLAIQSTLTRLVAGWEKMPPYLPWESDISWVIDSNLDLARWCAESRQAGLQRIFSVLSLNNIKTTRILVRRVQAGISQNQVVYTRMKAALNKTLWYRDLGSTVDRVLAGPTRNAVKLTLQDSLSAVPWRSNSSPAPVSARGTPDYLSIPPLDKDLLVHRFQKGLVALVFLQALNHSRKSRPPSFKQMKRREYTLETSKRPGWTQLDIQPQLNGAATSAYVSQPQPQPNSAEMDFRLWRNQTAADVDVAKPLFKFGVIFFIYALNTIFWLFLAVEPWPQVYEPLAWLSPIDEELASILDQLGELSQANSVNLERALDQINTLLANGKEAYWNESPWAYVQETLKESILDPLNNQDTPMLEVTFRGEGVSHAMKVSDFQDHLCSRIDLQAKLVEKGLLGAANNVRRELKEKMSQVWVFLRNDDEQRPKYARAPRRQYRAHTMERRPSPGGFQECSEI